MHGMQVSEVDNAWRSGVGKALGSGVHKVQGSGVCYSESSGQKYVMHRIENKKCPPLSSTTSPNCHSFPLSALFLPIQIALPSIDSPEVQVPNY